MLSETTQYFRRPNGGLLKVTGIGGPPQPPPESVEISQTVYETELAVVETARETARAATRAAEATLALTAYTALLASGLPPAVATLLSGHRPED